MFQPSRAFRLRQQLLPLRPHAPRFRSNRPRSQPISVFRLPFRTRREPVTYQPVRFRRPRLTWKKTISFTIYSATIGYLTYKLWRLIDIQLEFLDEEEAREQGITRQQGGSSEEQREGVEVDDDGPFYAEEDSWFIPITWARELPREFYKGSDPEWQEFIKLARNEARRTKVQEELANYVHTGVKKHPAFVRALGKDNKVGKYWLDISFPDGPPIEFERSGIEIGDGFLAWSQQRISAETQHRIMRAIWPQAAASGVWEASKALAGIQYRRLKQTLGWEEVNPFSPEERFKLAIQMVEKKQQQQSSSLKNRQTDPLTMTSSSERERPSLPLPFGLSTGPIPLPTLPDILSTPSGQLAIHTFEKTRAKTWNPKKMEPPRGSFVVAGLVEVRGSKGRALFDVSSAYDPKTNKYGVVNVGVRNLKQWNQKPKGGP